MDYFKDLFLISVIVSEIVGLELSVGFSAHRRTAIEKIEVCDCKSHSSSYPDFMNKFKDIYKLCSYPCRVDSLPVLLLYEWKRKLNLSSSFLLSLLITNVSKVYLKVRRI